MAREHANLSLDIWSDPDFQELPPSQQRLYMLLFSQKTINNAGVLPMQVSKWAKGSKHTTVAEIEADLAALESRRYVLADRDTEEVLVRSYIRRDGVAKHKYLLKNALTVAKRTESRVLRSALAVELRRLGSPEADVVADELAASATQTPLEPHSNGIPVASDSGSNAQVVVEVVVPLGTNGERNVGTPVGRPRSQAKRGTRIPDDFTASVEMVEWARAECPDVDGRRHTARFVNHWSSKTGKDATKLDWVRTWKNWMLEEQTKAERAQPRAPNGMNQTDSNINKLMSPDGSPPNLLALPGGVT